MVVESIQTRVLQPPRDDLLDALTSALSDLKNNDVLAVSSKVVAIWQGRCVPIPEDREEAAACKAKLIREEAECYLEEDAEYPYSRVFTINEGILGSSSGIDVSNGNKHFILLPKDGHAAALKLRSALMLHYSLTSLGIVIVDSRTQPLRNGTIGVALGYSGFSPLRDYRGTEDVFGNPLQYERLNLVDCIASTTVLAMGEGNESTPAVLLRDVASLSFGDSENEDSFMCPNSPLENDVFAQFLKPHDWKRGGREVT